MDIFNSQKDKIRSRNNLYFLVDVNKRPLATGLLTSAPDAPNMQIQITDGRPEDVVDAEIIQALPQSDGLPLRLGRVILRRGRLIVLDPLQELGPEARQNLRIPVDFDSFVYFRDGGRAPIRGVDLSCTGIAFRANCRLQPHEEVEIVIPITDEGPLILDAEILRDQDDGGGGRVFSAKFVNMLNDQEVCVREAVFHTQVLARPAAPKGR